MRKINVLEFISLDGVIQAPGGQEEDRSGGFTYGGWTHPHSDAVSSTAMQKQMRLPFDLLLGRKTFAIWAQFWPQHSDMWPAVNKTETLRRRSPKSNKRKVRICTSMEAQISCRRS